MPASIAGTRDGDACENSVQLGWLGNAPIEKGELSIVISLFATENHLQLYGNFRFCTLNITIFEKAERI
jgi:hypothetical protein